MVIIKMFLLEEKNDSQGIELRASGLSCGTMTTELWLSIATHPSAGNFGFYEHSYGEGEGVDEESCSSSTETLDFHAVTLESNYDRCSEIALLCSSNDTLGNLITTNNSSKYVHKDGIYLKHTHRQSKRNCCNFTVAT